MSFKRGVVVCFILEHITRKILGKVYVSQKIWKFQHKKRELLQRILVGNPPPENVNKKNFNTSCTLGVNPGVTLIFYVHSIPSCVYHITRVTL